MGRDEHMRGLVVHRNLRYKPIDRDRVRQLLKHVGEINDRSWREIRSVFVQKLIQVRIRRDQCRDLLHILQRQIKVVHRRRQS
ncbi:hypothetical protein D3C71_2140190 [compost metagenome]